MRIKVTLKRDPDRVRELLKFASKGVNTDRVEVHVKNSQHLYAGRCFGPPLPHMVNVARTTDFLVVLRLDPDGPKPGARTHGSTVILRKLWPEGLPLETWEDVAVFLAAHEFRHVWQGKRAKRKRLGRRDGKGEHDADKWAFHRLNLWRETTGREPVPPVKQPNPFKPS